MSTTKYHDLGRILRVIGSIGLLEQDIFGHCYILNGHSKINCKKNKKLYQMKKTSILLIVVLFSLFSWSGAMAQFSINASGSSPYSSIVLDVASLTKGMLVPNISVAQHTAVGHSASDLLVFQTDGVSGFYFYNGSIWVSLNSSAILVGGDFKGIYPSPTHATSDVRAGSYGSATQEPSPTVDAKGRILVVVNTPIASVVPSSASWFYRKIIENVTGATCFWTNYSC